MKTIREYFAEALEANGLWPEEAMSVIAQAEAAPDMVAMKVRWDEPMGAYPKAMMAVIWMGLKHTAVEWIDANKPLHWARPMFAE